MNAFLDDENRIMNENRMFFLKLKVKFYSLKTIISDILFFSDD